jgi:hypothetical protein
VQDPAPAAPRIDIDDPASLNRCAPDDDAVNPLLAFRAGIQQQAAPRFQQTANGARHTVEVVEGAQLEEQSREVKVQDPARQQRRRSGLIGRAHLVADHLARQPRVDGRERHHLPIRSLPGM